MPPEHPTYMGGAGPKVLAKPSTDWTQSRAQSKPKEGLDPVNHPHRWIHVEMEKTIHPHWWKELRASGRVSMGSHMIREGFSNSKAYYMPVGRQQHWGCTWPNMRLQGGGMPHPGLADSAAQTSCSTLMSLTQGIYGPWGRRRPLP